MIILDTTILVYALGSEHPAREPSRRLLGSIRDGKIAGTTTLGVIQEFVHVFSRRRPRATAAAHARRYSAGLAPLVVTSPEELEPGLRLFERHDRLGAFDALLAATALAAGADALVSADKSFAGIRGLRHIAPGTPEFERLLGSA